MRTPAAVCCRTGFALVLFLAGLARAQTPSPALLVLEKGANSLAIVDPASLKIVARVAAGTDPHEIVASDDGHFAYISNYGAFSMPQHTLSVVDLTTQKLLLTVDLANLIAPHGLDFVNGQVYFTAEGSKVIGRYDPVSNKVDWTLGIGQNRTHMLVVRDNATRIFTSNVNSDTIAFLERNKDADVSGWSTALVAVGKGPEGFDVSPDGKELWAANSGDGTISIIDIPGKKVMQTIDIRTKHSNRVKFTPDGKLVLVSDIGTGDLVVLDAASRKLIKRINLGHGSAGIMIAPDGSRAFVAVSPDNNVAVVDLKTLSLAGRIVTGNGPDGLAWAVRK